MAIAPVRTTESNKPRIIKPKLPLEAPTDHGTIGGYPKIGVVISADYDKLVQIPPGSKIKFKEINLKDAETIFKLYEMETQNLISNIK